MYRFKQKLITLLAFSACLFIVSIPAVAFAAPAATAPAADSSKAAVCEGVALTGSDCTTSAGPSVESSVATVINIFSFFVGIAAVIMIIIGGFKYIIASGDSSNIKSAKDTILYALIGLGVVALAQVIVKFVIHNVTP